MLYSRAQERKGHDGESQKKKKNRYLHLKPLTHRLNERRNPTKQILIINGRRATRFDMVVTGNGASVASAGDHEG